MTSTSVGRRRLRARFALLSLSTILCSGLAAPAYAQIVANQPTPPTVYNLDANGVDLVSGQFYTSSTVLSIGGNGGGLSFSRIQRSLGYDNSFDTGLKTGSVISIRIGGMSDSFTAAGTYSTVGTGARLVASGTYYDYITKDGTIYHFDPAYRNGITNGGLAAQKVATITEPNGRIITLGYDLSTQRPLGGGTGLPMSPPGRHLPPLSRPIPVSNIAPPVPVHRVGQPSVMFGTEATRSSRKPTPPETPVQ